MQDVVSKALAWDSEISVAVCVGNEGPASYLINRDEVTTIEYRMLLARLDCRYIGTLWIKDAVVDCTLVDLSQDTIGAMLSAVPAFVDYATKKRAAKGDSVEWLRQLASLPDEREAKQV